MFLFFTAFTFLKFYRDCAREKISCRFLLYLYQDLVPADTAGEFKASKEQIKQVTSRVQKLRDMTQRVAERSKGNAGDILGFGKELM